MSNTNLLGAYGGLGNSGLQFRNKIINGGMDIWQRSTAFSGTGGLPDGKGTYNSADRWKFLCTIMGTGYYNMPVTRSTDAPAGFAYSASVGNHYGTADHLGVMQPIEGISCADLAESGSCTISVYLKKGANAPAGKNITISLVQCKTADTHGNFIDDVAANYDVLGTQVTALDSLASWTRVTFTVTGLTADVARGLGVCFYISATDLNSGVDIFKFTGASLEAGPVATPFEHRPYGLELSLCHRYCYVTKRGGHASRVAMGIAKSTTQVDVMFSLPVEMRATPICSLSIITNWAVSDTTIGYIITAFGDFPVVASPRNACATVTVASGLTAFRPYFFENSDEPLAQVVISAEL